MSQIRNWVLASVFAGATLVAVGCGPVPAVPSTGDLKGKYDQNSAKAKEGMEGVGKGVKDGVDKVAAEGKELLEKAKAATEEIGKEKGIIEKAMEALGKAKADEKDATKAGALGKIETEAKTMFAGLGDKIKDLAGAKDLKSLDGIKTAIMDIIKGLKEKLKDFLPK